MLNPKIPDSTWIYFKHDIILNYFIKPWTRFNMQGGLFYNCAKWGTSCKSLTSLNHAALRTLKPYRHFVEQNTRLRSKLHVIFTFSYKSIILDWSLKIREMIFIWIYIFTHLIYIPRNSKFRPVDPVSASVISFCL